jgi:hypothetical protein
MSVRAKSFLSMLVCTAMLVIAAPALAASSPAESAYGGTGATQNSKILQNTQSAQSTLPFTGLNVGVLVAVGVALFGGGIVIRRTIRTQ